MEWPMEVKQSRTTFAIQIFQIRIIFKLIELIHYPIFKLQITRNKIENVIRDRTMLTVGQLWIDWWFHLHSTAALIVLLSLHVIDPLMTVIRQISSLCYSRSSIVWSGTKQNGHSLHHQKNIQLWSPYWFDIQFIGNCFTSTRSQAVNNFTLSPPHPTFRFDST